MNLLCLGCGSDLPMENTLDDEVELTYPEEVAPGADGVSVSYTVSSVHVVVTSALVAGLGAVVVVSENRVVSAPSEHVVSIETVAFADGYGADAVVMLGAIVLDSVMGLEAIDGLGVKGREAT